MSLRSPPGTGRQWPQLLAYVIDDDDRTRRAGVLLWHLTAALLTVGAMAITVALLAHRLGWYVGAGTSGAIVVFTWLRRARG